MGSPPDRDIGQVIPLIQIYDWLEGIGRDNYNCSVLALLRQGSSTTGRVQLIERVGRPIDRAFMHLAVTRGERMGAPRSDIRV